MLRVMPGPMRKRETLIKVPVYALGLGHATRFDPNNYAPGHSHRTYDVNLDQMRSVYQRAGIRSLCENPLGAQQMTAFEEALGGGIGNWGVPGQGTLTDDAVNFRQYEVSGIGTMGKKLSATAGGVTNPSCDMTLLAPVSLGADIDEFVALWVYVPSLANWTEARFTMMTDVNNRFLLRFGPVGTANRMAVVVGWNLLIRKKKDFTLANTGIIGAPDWTNITAYRLSLDATNPCEVTYDNAYIAPKQVDGLCNFRQPERLGGGNFKVGAARGTVAYLSAPERRWVPLVQGLTPYVPVNFEVFTGFCYYANGVEAVGVIIGDGAGALSPATTYTAGIAAPDLSAMTATENGAGGLPTGEHRYRLEYYSDVTGLPGSSGLSNFVAVTTGPGAKVSLADIPVSADAKVTKKRIYRKDATDAGFFRVVEIDNAVTSYDDVTANLDLGDELDGYPAYVRNGPPPVLSMLRVVGNRVIGAGDPAARGIVYVSRPNNAEQWDLAAAPTRLDVDDNDVITSLYNAFGYAGVGKSRANYIGSPVTGPSGFSFTRRSGNSGPVSHRGTISKESVVFWRGHDGYYAMGRDWNPRKISRDWETASAPAPGVIEPTFEMLDSKDPGYICAAYDSRLGQVLWTDKYLRDSARNLIAVFHVGQAEGGPPEKGGSVGGWSFHRYGGAETIAGCTALAEYFDVATGRYEVMSGGPGGFVYQVGTDEIDDVLPHTRAAIHGDIVFPFFGHRGVALGQHQIKDYVMHDMVFVPLGAWPVDLEYYFDWKYAGFAADEIPIGTDTFPSAALPFTIGPFYAETGAYVRQELPSGRHRNVAWRVHNPRLGESFHLSECTWFMEYLGAEGVI